MLPSMVCFLHVLAHCIGYTVLLCFVLACTGRSLGLRELFANTLVAIFEWGSSSGEAVLEYDWEEEEEKRRRKAEEQLAPRILTKRSSSSGNLAIIEREHCDSIQSKLHSEKCEAGGGYQGTVKVLVDDSLDFIVAGLESIIEDEVTSRFAAEQLMSWNLLTRTRYTFHFLSWKLTMLWFVGVLFRYLFALPIRFVLFVAGLACLGISTSLIGLIPHRGLRKWLNRRALLTSMRVFSRSCSAIVRFHNVENKAKAGGICVANHTSPLDVMILSIDNVYAMIGQKQGGFLGMLQTMLSRSEHHIWFQRSEASDRKKVIERMRDHVNDPNKLPIIIFPEGTCINNTGVMMFKKGSFELGGTIYPIAMKYDNRLGEAFWNSSKYSYLEYFFQMMTSWAINCDVWYLPPMKMEEGEDSIAFARRVKRAIAQKGGLVDLEWDGMLKREKVSSKMISLNQKLYYEHLTRTTSIAFTPEQKAAILDMVSKMTDCERQELLDGFENENEQTLMRKVSNMMPPANGVAPVTFE